MEAIIDSLKAFLSSYVVAGAVLVIAAVCGIWKLASKYFEKESKFNDTVANLPCSQHGSTLQNHSDQISSSKSMLDKMSGQLDTLLKLSTAARTKPLIIAETDYSEKHSPRRLNKNGEVLYADIEGEKFLDDNFKYFSSEIDRLAPKTALDVENAALAVLRISSNQDMFIPLKSWVYNAPVRKIKRPNGSEEPTEVSMDDIFFVLSLPLRDKYLITHPDIIK
ncbi:MAG: hypothetical protein K2G85_05930 [Muribaculaceae bacterium]|nr:hypothetical protein [Muribaculaceae bacterium]